MPRRSPRGGDRLAARSAGLRAGWAAEIERAGRAETINLAWLNHCLHAVIAPDTIVVNEYSFRQEYCPLDQPGSLFGVGPAGGLGWGFPAALGIKLAAPDKQVVALLGDGAYMFANPTACHFIAESQKLPVLTVIYNNALYGAVRRATLDMYRARRGGRGGRAVAGRTAQPGRSSESSRRMAAMASGWNIRRRCRRRCSARRRRCAAGSRRW